VEKLTTKQEIRTLYPHSFGLKNDIQAMFKSVMEPSAKDGNTGQILKLWCASTVYMMTNQ